jgi:uncharacterized membrane protein YozB (DUF420 family)
MLSDLSLLVQALAFSFLIYSVYRRRESIASHGKIASIAFYIALPAIFYMLYSKAGGFILLYYNWILSLHMFLGIMTIITGILFVTNQWKWKIKKYMDLEILLWTGTFLLGTIVYKILFGSIQI